MPVYLVRHAHAGNRSSWKGPDDERPLSPKGRHQATALATWLGDAALTRVGSSPAARCIETVEPLATTHGLEVEIDLRLAEGAEPSGCVDAVIEAGDRVVLCGHGDVIPNAIRRLVAEGMRTSDSSISQKGSAWVLEVVDGRVVSGSYRPPTRA